MRKRKWKLSRPLWLDKEKQVMRRKGADHTWIFFLGFCSFPIVVIRWFCLHSCSSGVRQLFGAQPKIGLTIFVSLHLFDLRLTLVFNLPRLPDKCSYMSRPFTPAWGWGGGQTHFLWFYTSVSLWSVGTTKSKRVKTFLK